MDAVATGRSGNACRKKLDEWTAEHLLGWRRQGEKWLTSDDQETSLKPFSTDLSVAWEIAEMICARGYRLQLDGSKIWQARFYKSAAHTLESITQSASGKTPAEAICMAALALNGKTPPKE